MSESLLIRNKQTGGRLHDIAVVTVFHEGRNCVCFVFGSLQRPLISLVFPETDVDIFLCLARRGHAMSQAGAEGLVSLGEDGDVLLLFSPCATARWPSPCICQSC